MNAQHPQVSDDVGLLVFDLWRNNRWVGMATGLTPADARRQLEQIYGEEPAKEMVLTPFYGCGTSDATYLALTGKQPV
jgi:hypothetical protein